MDQLTTVDVIIDVCLTYYSEITMSFINLVNLWKTNYSVNTCKNGFCKFDENAANMIWSA